MLVMMLYSRSGDAELPYLLNVIERVPVCRIHGVGGHDCRGVLVILKGVTCLGEGDGRSVGRDGITEAMHIATWEIVKSPEKCIVKYQRSSD